MHLYKHGSCVKFKADAQQLTALENILLEFFSSNTSNERKHEIGMLRNYFSKLSILKLLSLILVIGECFSIIIFLLLHLFS